MSVNHNQRIKQSSTYWSIKAIDYTEVINGYQLEIVTINSLLLKIMKKLTFSVKLLCNDLQCEKSYTNEFI